MHVCIVVCACVPVLGQETGERGGGLEVRLSLPHLMEERGVKLRLQLFVAVTLHNFGYFLLPPHVRRVVQVALQTLPSAYVDDRLAHEEPKSSAADHHAIHQRNHHAKFTHSTMQADPEESRLQRVDEDQRNVFF